MSCLKYILGCLIYAATLQAAVQTHSLKVLFDTDKSELSEAARQHLTDFISCIKPGTDFSIRLEGHTDDVGNLGYNDKLAARRSAAVKSFLIQSGINEGLIEAASFGERKPLRPNINDKHRDENRRVEVEIIFYDFDSIDELEETLNDKYTGFYIISPQTRNIIKGPQGVSMLIEPSSFPDSEGNTVTEDIEIQLTEAIGFESFVSHNLTTLSGNRLLESGGMLKLSASTVSGKEVRVNPEVPITTAVTAGPVKPGMQLFTSGQGDNWALTDNKVVSTLSLDMPPYPLLYFRSYSLPDYQRDLSNKPVKPDTYGRPRPPKAPDQQDYQAKITWYNFLFRGYLERRAREQYTAAMERYQKKLDLYQRRYDLYVEHNADKEKRFRNYKLDLKTWNEKCVSDSIAFLSSTEYQKLKEKNLLLMAEVRAKWEREVEEWEALRRERMGELAAKMDEMGVASEEAVNTYIFAMSELSWINIDRFYKMPTADLRSVTLRDVDESSEKVFVVFKRINSMLPMIRDERKPLYERDRFPKTEKAALLAYKVVDGKAMVYFEDIDPKRSSYKMDFQPYTFMELRKLLDSIQT